MTDNIEYIDITPTCRHVLPILVEAATNGDTSEGQRTAMADLIRMADLADAAVAARKAARDGTHVAI